MARTFYPQQFSNRGGGFADTDAGLCELVYPELWDASCVLATLGPQAPSLAARDHSGRNNHATLTNGATLIKQQYMGQGFGAVSLDGSNDYLSIPALSSSVYTLAFWIKPIVDQWSIVVREGAYLLNVFFADGNRLYSNTVMYGDYLYVPVTIGVWQHIAITQPGNYRSMYKNGMFAMGISHSESFYMSKVGQATDINNPLGGMFASIGVWFRGLSDAQIATLARHPLEAYKCKQRRVWFVPAAAPAAGNRRRRLLIAGGFR